MADFYRANIWDSTPARFLAERRLSHSTISRFRLGYVKEPYIPEHKRYTGSLVLPYEDGMGRVRSLRYRPLYGGTHAKYLADAGSQAHIFAVRATDNAVVRICEGEIDAMTLWQVGLPAVGIPGAAVWKDEWKWLFRDCVRVVLCFDADQAGMTGAARVYRSLASVTDVDIADLPPKQDVNDVLIRYGAKVLREVVA